MIVTSLINQDKKVVFIGVDEYGALEIYSEFMKTCQIMNIIVQTTGRDKSSLNGKSESPDNKLANTMKAILLNSSQKK